MIGWRTVLREDGKALEVGGISEEDADTYSDRAKELRDLTGEYAAQYERDHGHAPGKRAMWAIKQRAALETRDAKEHNPPPPGRSSPRGRGRPSGAVPGRCPRFTGERPFTRPSTGRASCRAKRSGPGSSARR